MQAIGYKEPAMALRGEISRGEAVELIKLGSRRYAKRQMTWFRRTKNALRIDWDENPDFEAARRLSTAFCTTPVYYKYRITRREKIICPSEKKELAKMQKTQNLQDIFLNQARRDKSVVTMFLMNGFQLHGIVRGYDSFTVILDSDGKQQLIYKHAISTVVPPKPINLELDT